MSLRIIFVTVSVMPRLSYATVTSGEARGRARRGPLPVAPDLPLPGAQARTLRRTRSTEAFPPWVREADEENTRQSTHGGAAGSPAVPARHEDGPSVDDLPPPLPRLMPQDDMDELLLDDEGDEFMEMTEEEQQARRPPAPRMVITHVATENGRTIRVQATEEAAWGSRTLTARDEEFFWEQIHLWEEGADPSTLAPWVVDRWEGLVREHRQAEEEAQAAAANPVPRPPPINGFDQHPQPRETITQSRRRRRKAAQAKAAALLAQANAQASEPPARPVQRRPLQQRRPPSSLPQRLQSQRLLRRTPC